MTKYGETTPDETKAIADLEQAIKSLPAKIQLEPDYAPSMMAVWKYKGNGVSEVVAELEIPKL